MNTRQTRFTLLGLAFGILLALLISPQTRWLVRAQLLPSALLPGHYEQQKRLFVEQHPGDYQIQLAGQTENSHLTQVDYARSLVLRFPDSASLQAYILRYATVREVRLARDEDFLLGGQPVPAHAAAPNNPPPTAANLAAFDAEAAAGERLDPDNAYFPFMRAFGLFAAHHDSEGLAAVQRASEKHIWREYLDDEVEGHWRINDAIYGGREAISAGAVSASVLFPHYQQLRGVARVVAYKAILDEQAGHPEQGLAKREALGRCGELMQVQSTSLIGNLVGGAINAISRSRPGGAPPLNSNSHLSGTQQQQERLNLYCAYVVKIGHPEAAAKARADNQTWQQIHRITSKIDMFYFGIGMAGLTRLMVMLIAGWVLFPNILSVFLLGLVAAGLSRLPQIQARRPLPAGAAAGVWSIVVIGLVLVAVFFDAGSADFLMFGALVVSLPLIFMALLALVSPPLRRSIVTALLSAGVTLGVIALFGLLASWQMHGGTELVTTLRQTLGLSGSASGSTASFDDKAAQSQILLGAAFALTIPLLFAIVWSIVCRVKRVPVSVGLVAGFRAAMPALVCGLMLAYGGLVLWTIRQEARANYGLKRSLHGEGQYLAQRTGEKWPVE